jgi:hypothetical protein
MRTPARAATATATLAIAAVAAGCMPSPTERGFAGQVGLASHDAGASGCVIEPTTSLAARSAGCGKPPAHAAGEYVERPLAVACAAEDARDRLYYVRLPPGYDPNRAYRTIYLGQGCGPPQPQIPTQIKAYPMEDASGSDAILIEMEAGLYNKAEYNSATCSNEPGASNLCHFCFDDGAASLSPDSVEYAYFDRLHRQIEADYCVDATRQFYAGYSSGGWMAHQLGCQFSDVLRAQASVTGGLPLAIRDGAKLCVDKPIAAFLIHDFNDQSNIYQGSVAALNRLLALNGCAGGATMDTAPTAPYTITGVPNTAAFSCVQYAGCPAQYPIVFCTSQDQQHNAQTAAAVPGFWEFFSRL